MLHDEPAFSTLFISYLLARNVRMEADLVDPLFNSSRSGWHGSSFYWRISAKKENRSPVIAKVNQETLAEMIGTLASS